MTFQPYLFLLIHMQSEALRFVSRVTSVIDASLRGFFQAILGLKMRGLNGFWGRD
jgi:hypothetical protein